MSYGFSVGLAATLLFVGTLPVHGAALEVQKVVDDVYALVGDLDQRSPENYGNNATFGVIVTGAGVVLVDPGGSYKGAEQVHQAIRTITDKPVKVVINSGGQDHRWLGNVYFKKQGARLIASQAAVADQKARARDQLIGLDNLVGAEGMKGTQEVYADETFEKELALSIGGERMILRHSGAAHTPGDSYVWLPDKKVVFTGDIVYTERMLTIGSFSRSGSWVKVFDEIAALQPKHVVPGHGRATDLKRARADTGDYLVALRAGIRKFIDEGIGIERAGTVEQSRFAYLKFYDDIKGRNAQQVYQEMEWE